MAFEPQIPESLDASKSRELLKEAADYIRGLESVPADKRGESHAEDVRSAVKFIQTFDAVESAYTKAERAAQDGGSRGPAAALEQIQQRGPLSPGQQLIESEGYKDFARSRQAGATHYEFEIEGSLHKRTLIDLGGTTGAGWAPVGQPTTPLPRQQRLFVRDLLGGGQPSDLVTHPYIQEVNPATNELGATAVAEGAAKAEVTMETSLEEATQKKIAAWLPVTTEVVESAPTLLAYIETRLVYMLALREEHQILNGPGTTANVLGIRQSSGVQTQTAVGTNDLPATLGMAYAKIENVDGEVDGVAVNPIDYWKGVTARHSSGFDNGSGGNAPAIVGNITWGVPAVRTRSMESGKALAGSWRLGAGLFDIGGTVVRVGTQHSTYFTENKVAVLAEERIVLPVYRPDLFCEATITFS